jgi:hypothetical protein
MGDFNGYYEVVEVSYMQERFISSMRIVSYFLKEVFCCGRSSPNHGFTFERV